MIETTDTTGLADAKLKAAGEHSRGLSLMVLTVVCLGLLAMFAGSFAYRLGHPSLIKRSGAQEQRESQRNALEGGQEDVGLNGEQVQMPAEAMQRIVELMTRLKENPDSYELRLELAEHFIEISNWKNAIPHLEKAREINPKDLQTLRYLGFCYFSVGDHESAAEHYAKVVERSGDANAKVNLAYIYKNFLDRAPEADAIFDDVINDPNVDSELRAVAEQIKSAQNK